MNLSVFIIENDLPDCKRLAAILEQSGHLVIGSGTLHSPVATFLDDIRPDIVLLNFTDGFDDLTIKLAAKLKDMNIPFILTASSYSAGLRHLMTKIKPQGFLTKPVVDKEVLAVLDLAIYNNHISGSIQQRQEIWLETLLLNILESPIGKTDMLLSLVKAFASFMPFDYLVIDTDLHQRNPEVLFSYQRTGIDKYNEMTGVECAKGFNLTVDELFAYRRCIGLIKAIEFLNAEKFSKLITHIACGDKILRTHHFQSIIWIPLYLDNKIEMGLSFYSKKPDLFDEGYTEFMRIFRNVFSSVLLNIRDDRQKTKHFTTTHESLNTPLSLPGAGIDGIIGVNPKLLDALDQALHVARFDNSVLVLGETGVGKEGLVRAIHKHSKRKNGPFIKVNCAAIAPNLFESEFFGYEKGAFTGAVDQRMGKFEQASGGTLFLDEIGELSMEAQGKLLRALQEREIDRIGGKGAIKIDVRIVAATNKNLYAEVANGRFRIDLYYRINVFPISLPPLRERKDDIPQLTQYFLNRFNAYHNQKISVTNAALKQLQAYSWPGNIRELEHFIERHILSSRSGSIAHFDIPQELHLNGFQEINAGEIKPIAQINKEHILTALHKSNGKVSGINGAASLLRIPSTTLISRMKKLGIR